jgi:hypothetical protein
VRVTKDEFGDTEGIFCTHVVSASFRIGGGGGLPRRSRQPLRG